MSAAELVLADVIDIEVKTECEERVGGSNV